MIYLAIITFLGTAIWPVARWALAENGNSRVMGFWVSLTVSIASLILLLMREAPLYNPELWIAGAVFALAYAIGFNILIMRSLQLGPAGPTATLNNSAMIFGVLYSVIWLDPHIPNLWITVGIVGISVALTLIGVGGKDLNSETAAHSHLWLRLVLMGSALSGLSFISQTYVGVRHSGVNNSLLFTCVGFGLSAVILLISMFNTPSLLIRHKRELTGGIALGLVNLLGMTLTNLAFRDLGADIVLPITVTAPMVFVLFIGKLAYGERLNRQVWTGCVLVIFSVGLLGYGSTLKSEAASTTPPGASEPGRGR